MLHKINDYLNGETHLASAARLFLSFGSVLIIWEILTATIVTNRLLLVPPMEVLYAFMNEVSSGEMWTNAQATVLAVGTSFPVAVLVGVLIGLILASSRAMSLMGGPMLTALNSVPIIALAPLFIAWLGLGFTSKFVLVLLVAVFPVVVTTEAGLRAADKNLIETARSFNATPLQIFTTVTFPYALPFIVSGVRVAWARALVGIVVAEFFGSFAGFGFAVMAASQTFDTATLLAYVIVLGVMGLVGSMIFQSIEERLAPWRKA
ncbi:ABC transporter permease [Mariluticola halotolerans]|uniref:ABC transporter permease n=1 Tax=Mariluticola halotolerans TaxID=2909283 RepID=UPI0026E37C1F|nr:ABC transporter permease [Mariluticola halotolerans]UJQ93570.1 ABC transporter permease [Mariluticola halotolerans]